MTRLFRRKPCVLRLHLVLSDRQKVEATVEGIFVGFRAGHYQLANARHVEAEDRKLPLDGVAWIPKARVLYAQEVNA